MGLPTDFLGICLLDLPGHLDSHEHFWQTPHLGARGQGAAERWGSQLAGGGAIGLLTGCFPTRPFHHPSMYPTGLSDGSGQG